MTLAYVTWRSPGASDAQDRAHAARRGAALTLAQHRANRVTAAQSPQRGGITKMNVIAIHDQVNRHRADPANDDCTVTGLAYRDSTPASAWLSPKFPVCGDLNIATALEAMGNNPTSGRRSR